MRNSLLLLLFSCALLFAQGNAIVQITNLPTDELCPRLSPDGKRLSFVMASNTAGTPPTANITITTSDGRSPVSATTAPAGQFCLCPSWFPKSDQVAYERLIVNFGKPHYEIWSVPINGGNGARLVQNNFRWDFMPDISVKGDVAFVTSGNDFTPFPPGWVDVDLYRTNPPPEVGGMGWPSFRPYFIAIKPAGSSGITNTVPGLYPRWDPTGTRIAYSAWNPATGWDIIVADYRGGSGLINTRSVTTDNGDEFAPSWSPDGKWIAYSHAPGPPPPGMPPGPVNSNIFIVNVDDGTKIQETFLAGTRRASMPDWGISQSGDALIYFHSDMNTPPGSPPNFNIYSVRTMVKLGASVAVSSAPQAGGAQRNFIAVRVLNSSADKDPDTAPDAQGFAAKVAKAIRNVDKKIKVVDVANGVDSGIPQVYYNGSQYKDLAEKIAKYLDGLVNSGELVTTTPYMFSPASPLPGGYAKDVDIVVEAPANSEESTEAESATTEQETQ